MLLIIFFLIYLLCKKINLIYDNIKKKFNIDDEYIKIIKDLIPEFKGTIDLSDITSYTVNKKNIFLKIDFEKDLQSNLNVIFHEIAHCLVEEIGHGEEFQKKLEELFNRARLKGYIKK